MAYDQQLAERVRKALSDHTALTEKEMFGGLAFLIRGHTCCGIVGDELMVRVGPDAHGAALSKPHARPMDFTGRPLRGYVFVTPAGLRSARALQSWVEWGARFTASLPPKSQRSARSGKPRRA